MTQMLQNCYETFIYSTFTEELFPILESSGRHCRSALHLIFRLPFCGGTVTGFTSALRLARRVTGETAEWKQGWRSFNSLRSRPFVICCRCPGDNQAVPDAMLPPHPVVTSDPVVPEIQQRSGHLPWTVSTLTVLREHRLQISFYSSLSGEWRYVTCCR